MKLKLQKMALSAGKFVLSAVIDKLALLLAGALSGFAYKGLNKFREKRALKKAEKEAAKAVTVEENTEAKITDEIPVTETAEEITEMTETEDKIEETDTSED